MGSNNMNVGGGRHKFGRFEIDLDSHFLSRDGKQIFDITEKRWALLSRLAQSSPGQVSEKEFFHEFWGGDDYERKQLLSTFTSELNAWMEHKNLVRRGGGYFYLTVTVEPATDSNNSPPEISAGPIRAHVGPTGG